MDSEFTINPAVDRSTEPVEVSSHDASACIVTLEEYLAAHEADVDLLIKSAARYASALKAWKKACKSGHMGARQKASGQAVQAAADLPQPVREIAGSWNFDVSEWLSSGAWRAEIAQAVRSQHGLRTFDDPSGALVCPPLAVQADPGRGRLQVNRAGVAGVRPSAVADVMKHAHDRISSANCQEFLEGLYAACRFLCGSERLFARFRDVYDVFCLTPGWKKDNPPLVFGQNIYALHASEVRATRDKRTFQIETPGGKAKEKDIFTMYGEDGVVRRYYGIHFF